MTTPFFTEADCDGVQLARQYINSIAGPITQTKSISLEKANALILERSRVVHSPGTDNDHIWTAIKCELDTHQALLICIEPIAQPDSAERILRDLISTESNCGGVERLAERARKLLERKDGV